MNLNGKQKEYHNHIQTHRKLSDFERMVITIQWNKTLQKEAKELRQEVSSLQEEIETLKDVNKRENERYIESQQVYQDLRNSIKNKKREIRSLHSQLSQMAAKIKH